MSKSAAAIVAMVVAFSLVVPSGYADRCILPISDADVYGPGQKAIVAWNGMTERLILSTDLYASSDTKILEVLPLPSEPTVEKGSFESFRAIQELMMNNLPRVSLAGKELQGLEMVFHERIGVHDITVVRVASIDDLLNFMLRLAEKMNVRRSLAIDDKTRGILGDYLDRGFNYWVLDSVDLDSTAKSIEPIVYEFESSSLYYPLKVSATSKGQTQVTLYVITGEPILENDVPKKIGLARFQSTGQAIQFPLSTIDLSIVDLKLTGLFPAADVAVAWFTALKYEGDAADLDLDLEIPKRPAACRTIQVTTDRAEYTVGETVATTVIFTHLLPECVEIEVLHFHQVRLEIHNSKGALADSWEWQTGGDLSVEVTWKLQEADTYSITASSWWDGQKLEVDDQTSIAASNTSIPDTLPRDAEIRWLLYGVIIATICILVGAMVTYLLLRSKHSEKVGPQQVNPSC